MKEPHCALEGPFITTVKLGPKGQIVIPKEIRSRCSIQPGENLVLINAPKNGFTVLPASACRSLADHLLSQLPSVLDILEHEEQTHSASAAGNTTALEGDPL